MLPSVKVREIILERIPFAASQYITHHALASLKVDAINDEYPQAIILRLRSEIVAEKLIDEVQTVEYPATWWEHFKYDHRYGLILGKLSDLFSVRMTKVTINFEKYATYPWLPKVFPECGPIVIKSFSSRNSSTAA